MPMSSSIASAALCARLFFVGARAAAGAAAGAVVDGATTGLVPTSAAPLEPASLPVRAGGSAALPAEDPVPPAAVPADALVAVDPLLAPDPFGTGGGGGGGGALAVVRGAASGVARA